VNLRILLPFSVYADVGDVRRIVVETNDGSYGLLPNRLDCVMALVPGILLYETAGGMEKFVAVADGVLVKSGAEVLVSVRNAIEGAALPQLRATVEKEFRAVNEEEAAVQSALARVEGDLIQRLTDVHYGRRGG
jgi:F-type H+-transporting ATPase subunit epsilon